MAQRSELVTYLDTRLDVAQWPDFPGARNGLQLEGHPDVRRIGWAVDACGDSVRDALSKGVDFLLVHHGLLWGDPQPIVGERAHWMRAAMQAGLSIYSAHLPLDGDMEFGNAALLARDMGLLSLEPFGDYGGRSIGVQAHVNLAQAQCVQLLVRSCSAPVAVAGAPWPDAESYRLAIVTGNAGKLVIPAAHAGVRVLVTGEVDHHVMVDARSLGVTLVLAGHYASETAGVRALCEWLAQRFSIPYAACGCPPVSIKTWFDNFSGDRV